MSEKTKVEKAKNHFQRNWKRYALGAGTVAALGAGYHQRDRLKGAGKTVQDFVLGRKGPREGVVTAGDRPNNVLGPKGVVTSGGRPNTAETPAKAPEKPKEDKQNRVVV